VVSINRQRGTECAAHLALVGGDHYARALAEDRPTAAAPSVTIAVRSSS